MTCPTTIKGDVDEGPLFWGQSVAGGDAVRDKRAGVRYGGRPGSVSRVGPDDHVHWIGRRNGSERPRGERASL